MATASGDATRPGHPSKYDNKENAQGVSIGNHEDDIGGIMRVTKAMEVLRDITLADIRTELRLVFASVPFYANTALDTKHYLKSPNNNQGAQNLLAGSSKSCRSITTTSSNPTSVSAASSSKALPKGVSSIKIKPSNTPVEIASAGNAQVSSAEISDELIRKNIYYLASILQNLNQVLIKLIQKGVLRLTDRDYIMEPDFSCGDDTLKSLRFYELLIQMTPEQFAIYRNILKLTENEQTDDYFAQTDQFVPLDITANLPAESNRRRPHVFGANIPEPAGVPSLHRPEPIANPRPRPIRRSLACWECRRCTYKNTLDKEACEMCSTNRNAVDPEHVGLDVAPPEEGIVCRNCTFFNAATAIICAVCDTELNLLEFIGID